MCFFSSILQEHGAAFETGGLEVGQLILEVDGNKVEGMHHQVNESLKVLGVFSYENVAIIVLFICRTLHALLPNALPIRISRI